MHIRNTQSLATKRPMTKKVVAGFTAIAATAVIGSAGVAAAHPMPHHMHGGNGYGGNGNHVSTGVDVNVHGNNNVINIVINYFFGS